MAALVGDPLHVHQRGQARVRYTPEHPPAGSERRLERVGPCGRYGLHQQICIDHIYIYVLLSCVGVFVIVLCVIALLYTFI